MADKTETEADMASKTADEAVEAFERDYCGNFGIIPDGYKVQPLEEFQKYPNRVRADHVFSETASLAEYVNRFWTEDSMISANVTDFVIAATIDGDGDLPGWKKHNASFKAVIHDKLQAWLDRCDKPLSQVDFGHFLETRSQDVVFPDAASVMDMVLKFEAIKKVDFRSSTRLHDGSRQFSYAEDTQATGSVVLPDHFIIKTPIFLGSDPESVKFLIRYRIVEGKLIFGMEMFDKEEVLRAAFDRCIDAFKVDLTEDAFIFKKR